MTDTNEVICECGHEAVVHAFTFGCEEDDCICDKNEAGVLRSRLSALQTAHEEDGRQIEHLRQSLERVDYECTIKEEDDEVGDFITTEIIKKVRL